MRYFPIFYDLKDRLVVVVGGGEEALRKIRLLLKTEARIAVIARGSSSGAGRRAARHWLAKSYTPELLAGAALVYSADPALNETRGAGCERAGPAGQCRRQPRHLDLHRALDRRPRPSGRGDRHRRNRPDPRPGPARTHRRDAAAGAGRAGPRRLGPARPRCRDHSARQSPPLLLVRASSSATCAMPSSPAKPCNYLAGVEKLFDERSRIRRSAASPSWSLGSDDPELLTIKAQRKLHEADVIVHDRASCRRPFSKWPGAMRCASR